MTTATLNVYDEVSLSKRIRVVNRLLGEDLSARTLTIVTFLIRFVIVMLVIAHYVQGTNAIGTDIAIRFFSMAGAMAVSIVRWCEYLNYIEKDPRRARRALRSVPITLAIAEFGGWQFFSIY